MMVPRKALTVLVFGIPVLLVTFTVVMAFELVLSAVGDAGSAAAARAVGVGTLALLLIDLTLVISALGFRALEQPEAAFDESLDATLEEPLEG